MLLSVLCKGELHVLSDLFNLPDLISTMVQDLQKQFPQEFRSVSVKISKCRVVFVV